MHAKLTFVKAESGEHHRVWIEPDGRPAIGPRLHVGHDLPHLVVESFLGLEDGLWGCLVAEGTYPGLTDGHLVAKSVTNAISSALRHGPQTASGVRAHLDSFRRPDREKRRSFDEALARRRQELVLACLARLDDEDVRSVAAHLRAMALRWSSTPVGEVMRLEWPLSIQGPE